jgi:hypothetical protein
MRYAVFIGVSGMKKWFIIIGIMVILIIGGYLLLSFYAVKFIQARLQQVAGPGLTIAEINIKPTHLSAKGIRYEDPLSKRRFFVIEEMRIYPGLTYFLKGAIRVRECMILRPSFFFYRSREGDFTGPWATPEKKGKEKEISEDQGGERREPIQIKIDKFRIQKGSVDFEDRKMGEPPAQIQLRELDLELKNIQYPFIPSHSPVELRGKIKGGKKDGNIYTQGWLDLKTIDMETSFQVEGIEIKIFEPYYRKRVSAEIESGSINMEARIALKNRVIDAPGRLELADLHLKEGGTVFWIPAKMLVSFLKNNENRILIKFQVKGNLDDPQFNLQETLLTRIAVSLAEALGIPIKVVGETLIKGTGKGAEGLIEGLRSIEELFKKKKEEK